MEVKHRTTSGPKQEAGVPKEGLQTDLQHKHTVLFTLQPALSRTAHRFWCSLNIQAREPKMRAGESHRAASNLCICTGQQAGNKTHFFFSTRKRKDLCNLHKKKKKNIIEPQNGRVGRDLKDHPSCKPCCGPAAAGMLQAAPAASGTASSGAGPHGPGKAVTPGLRKCTSRISRLP